MAERMTVALSLKLRQLLQESPKTYEQLAELSGINQSRVARWRKSNAEFIHVDHWAPDKNGRLFIPVFSWGAWPDKPRPGRVLSSAERMRIHRARAKQSPVAQTAGGIGLDELI